MSGFAAIKIRLNNGADRGRLRANAFDQFYRALGVKGAFHVDAQEAFIGRGALCNGKTPILRRIRR